jgi:hypothetical protein
VKWLAASLLLLLCPSLAHAQRQIVTSDTVETVNLTVYRTPYRGNAPINKDWPAGYALITETRTITIPAGESLIRFEGVAEGMFPESAIVTGLPKGVREKNRDARLLSPSGLVDAYLKRRVLLTRTDKATGKVHEEEAMITAGPDGGVIVQTATGYEALDCTGLPERMRYGSLPEDLSAKPTLSVITQSDSAVTAKVTLTYMAAGFDWQANYVTQVESDEEAARGTIGKNKVDVFAWLTIANGGNQSFENANMMAIAGTPNRERDAPQVKPKGGALTLKCWPMQRTHQVPFRRGYMINDIRRKQREARMEALQDAPMALTAISSDELSRLPSLKKVAPTAAVVAEQEELGDLKLYRIPEPVTVNAKGQKQVAMIVKPAAKFDRLYQMSVTDHYEDDGKSQPMNILLRGENVKDKGLGLPMPSGQMMIFESSNYGPLLAGESDLEDRAVGEEVEVIVGESPDVRFALTKLNETRKMQRYKVVITSARNEDVNAEIEIPYELRSKVKGISKVDGIPTWKGVVPAFGEVVFFYEIKLGR